MAGDPHIKNKPFYPILHSHPYFLYYWRGGGGNFIFSTKERACFPRMLPQVCLNFVVASWGLIKIGVEIILEVPDRYDSLTIVLFVSSLRLTFGMNVLQPRFSVNTRT